MRKYRWSPLAAVLGGALLSEPVLAEVETDGFAETWIRYGDGDFLSSEVRVEFEAKTTLGEAEEESEGADLFADFGAGPKEKLPEIRARVRGWVDPSGFEARAKGEFYTGGVTFFPRDDVSVFIGKDYMIWGKADKINPVDVINADDFTQFIVQPKERRKLSNLMLNVTYAAGDDKLQFIYNPFYVQNDLAQPDSPWCGTRCQFGQPQPFAPFVAVNDIESDRRNIEDSEFALRYSSRIDRVDYSLLVHNGFDRIPVWSHRFTGTLNVEFNRELKRRWRFGGDVAFTLGSFGIRAEVLYQPESVQHFEPRSEDFFIDDDGLDDVDQINWVLGVDWTTDSDIYVNVQYAENTLLKKGNYFRNPFQTLGTLQLSKTVLNDDLELKVSGFYEFTDNSYAFTPEAVYRINDDLHWTTGLWVFTGSEGAFFGDQRDNDHIFTQLKYIF